MTYTSKGDERVLPGWLFLGTTKNELWGQWKEKGDSSTPEQREQQRQERQRIVEARKLAEQQQRAASLPAAKRDPLYRQLLAQLSLQPDDREDLLARGFTSEQIQKFGARSVEQWQKLEESLPHTLPGVSLDGHSLNVSKGGYLCPIYDVDALLVGFQLRRREGGDGGRYRWLSSVTKKRPNGPAPNLPNGELPLAVYQPAHAQTGIVALVEGTGPKPFLVSERLHVITVGAAGGQFASSAETLKYTLEKLGAKSVILYPDAGDVLNKSVMRRWWKTAQLLQHLGYPCQVAWWGQVDKKPDPDIDELQDLTKIEIISFAQFEQKARQQERKLLHCVQQISHLFKPKRQRPSTPPSDLTPWQGHEYSAGQRLHAWQAAIKAGYRYVLDQSVTGTGKSFDSGLVNPQDFKVERVLYYSAQHRNPTVDTLKAENGWVDLEARHGGLIREATPGGGTRWKRVSKGEKADTPANCNRHGLISALRGKNIPGADTAALVCGTCPLKEACQSSSGPGFGYLNQRRFALSSPKLRLHPDSSPDPTEFDYSNTLALWDEPGETFNGVRETVVGLADVDRVTAELSRINFNLLTQVQPLLLALYGMLQAKKGKFGLGDAQLRAKLPTPAIDAAEVEQALRPNLDWLDSTAQYGVELADLPAKVRKSFTERDRTLAEVAEERVIKQWLPDLIRLLQGHPGAMNAQWDRLTLTLPDERHRELAAAHKAVIFLDATLSPEDLALKLGCSVEDIYVCRQHVEETDNLSITQVTDLGRLGLQRGREQEKRAEALISHYQGLDPDAKVIDFKKFGADGAWWRDSRGVNDFTRTQTLILVGTPCRNLASLQAEYACLTEQQIDPENEAFKAFLNRQIRSDIWQAVGRLRAHRRSDEQLQVILLSDFEAGLPAQRVTASSITVEAASKVERVQLAIQGAVEQLQQAGQKVTQSAIAAITGLSQGYISRFRALLQTLLDSPNSKSNNFADPAKVELVNELLLECQTTQEAVSTVQSLIDFIPSKREWLAIWRHLSGQAQILLMQTLSLGLPPQNLLEVGT
ncbi:MAG TPA: hypothetical protein V6D07_13200 [Trichocoleus sp.]